jgi:hypothetical protein
MGPIRTELDLNYKIAAKTTDSAKVEEQLNSHARAASEIPRSSVNPDGQA